MFSGFSPSISGGSKSNYTSVYVLYGQDSSNIYILTLRMLCVHIHQYTVHTHIYIYISSSSSPFYTISYVFITFHPMPHYPTWFQDHENSFIEIHHDLSSKWFHHHFITWITAVDWNPVTSCRCLATFQDGSGGSCRDVGIVAGRALSSGVEWPGMTTD